MEVFSTFEKVYVINRDIDTSRLISIKQQMSLIGCENYEVVKAIDGWKGSKYYKETEENSLYDGWTKGAAGLVETTIGIIKDAKKNTYNSIVIIEDDVIFNPSIKALEKKIKDFLPPFWELFHYTSKDYKKPIRLGKLKQLTGAWSCQCYAVNSTIYDEYIDLLETSYVPIDLITSRTFHARGKSFAYRYNQVITLPNKSSIRGVEIDYRY